jgi:chorismate mutase/prephenate dehydrogenase
MSSTTFDAQLDVATTVSEESPELYYEIQALNDYGAESLQALSESVQRLRTAVLTRDFATFRSLMEQGLAYLKDRREQVAMRA